ncbi:MAG: response regulator transcription factor [Nannocystaceae bacterium]|nr:response regulator [Myxococcales bacterium]
MKILIADDDEFFRQLYKTLLSPLGYECVPARDGAEAVAIATAPDGPRLILLDWVMPDVDGLEACQRIRQMANDPYRYVIMVSARGRPRDLLAGFQAGADDFLTKPFTTEELYARVRAGERLLRAGDKAPSLVAALNEALAAEGGDVIVREGDRVARVMVHDGRIAWIHVSSSPGTLHDVLAGVASISRDEIREVLEECAATGASFSDVIVRWGLLDARALREVVRAWLAEKLQQVLEMRAPIVLFSPQRRSFAGDLSFTIDELFPGGLGRLEARGELPLGETPEVSGAAWVPISLPEREDVETDATEWSESLERALAVDGAMTAAIVDCRGGRIVASRGAPLDRDLVWPLAKHMQSGVDTHGIDDMIVTTTTAYHHLHLLLPNSRYLIYLALDRDAATLAITRHALARITSRLRATHGESR